MMDTTPSQNESDRMFGVNDLGHEYTLHNVQDGVQTIRFIKKNSVNPESKDLETIYDGTTNEAVLQVLINRMEYLHDILPDDYTSNALDHLNAALSNLEQRTADRKARSVEGTNNS